MPKFTVSRDGQTLKTLQLDGERIELGSANTCSLFIDDLLVSLHQAAFLKIQGGYDIEPIARTPAFTMNGQVVDQRTRVIPNAVIEVEGYQIQVEMDASSVPVPAAHRAAPPPPPPLPEPLDLPPVAPLKPPAPTPVAARQTPPSPPRENSLPPLPPPLPPIPEPLFADNIPPPEPRAAEPPPLPPLPPLPPSPSAGPPPAARKEAARAEAATQYVAPIKPIGQLVVTAGPLSGKKWPLSAGELKIGREQGQNDILVRFDAQGEIDTSISRRHASIHVEGEYAYVEDKGSVAGTYVNGRQAKSGERIPLRSGDEVEIRSAKVSTVFRVELGSQQPPPVRPAAPPPPIAEARRESLPPKVPSPARHEPYPAPAAHAEAPRDAEPIRRRERRPRLDEDNPFAPREEAGMPQWVWFAIGGAVVVIILILVFVFI